MKLTYHSGATLSPCGRYRYVLTREWSPVGDPAVFLMLNPSTADHVIDDPTIRRCVGFAKAWGFGRLVVANLFALRATNPYELVLAPDPIGPDNDAHIVEQCAGRRVFAAWGVTVANMSVPALRNRAAVVRRLIGANALVEHLGLTKDGHPKHPLYLPTATVPQPFPEPST